jgi:hypothetical protein
VKGRKGEGMKGRMGEEVRKRSIEYENYRRREIPEGFNYE